MTDPIEVFEQKVKIPEKDRFNSCWEWTGFFYRGAGVIRVKGTRHLAHRVAWELERPDDAPPEKMHLTCGNPKCVNPWHRSENPPQATRFQAFHRHVDIPMDISACWDWKGPVGRNGTPTMNAEGKSWSARTFSKGEEIGHENVAKQYIPKCGNQLCVNPEHLSATIPLEKKFWSKVDKDAPGGCWLWTGARRKARNGTNSDGMFQMRQETARSYHAHRIAWILSGRKLEKGKMLYSTCGNSLCVNPDHRVQEPRRAPPPFPHTAGDDHPASKLTEQQIPAILRMIDDGVPDTKTARRYRVSNVTIAKKRLC